MTGRHPLECLIDPMQHSPSNEGLKDSNKVDFHADTVYGRPASKTRVREKGDCRSQPEMADVNILMPAT